VVAGESGEAGNPGTVLMTNGSVGIPSGNWFEGSQVSKARPGAPFDFTLRCCRGHKLCHFSRLALGESAARDDKGKGGILMDSGCWKEGVFHHLRWAAGP
jgi:hypothetical protein